METKNTVKYFDYKRNEIKLGMDLCIISTKSPFSKMYGMNPLTKEKTKEMDVQVNEWRVILEYEVVMEENYPDILYAVTKGELKISKPLSQLLDSLSENQIVAIKGISDMEKDLSYWKKNAEEDYMKVPISVLRYITELEKVVLPQDVIKQK
jgi:hypothetical protein